MQSLTVDSNACILVVDDDLSNLWVVEAILREAGYTEVHCATNGQDALEFFKRVEPDLVLLDLHMPGVDGLSTLETLRWMRPGVRLPIVVLTADISDEAKREALAVGATDFLTKPADVAEIVLRVGNLLQTQRLHKELIETNSRLEHQVRERTEDLEQSQREMVQRLVLVAESRDDGTHERQLRVGAMARAIAHALNLSEAEADVLESAARLHDLGNIGVPEAILLKPGRLTTDEFEAIKRHVYIGASILALSSEPIMQAAQEIALAHHERWDGTGYAGIAGAAIPLRARIVSVCDVFEALTHARPYADAWSREAALAEIDVQRGHQFDPRVVEAFFEAVAATTDRAEVCASVSPCRPLLPLP
jgi:putative two-component system response regulator